MAILTASDIRAAIYSGYKRFYGDCAAIVPAQVLDFSTEAVMDQIDRIAEPAADEESGDPSAYDLRAAAYDIATANGGFISSQSELHEFAAEVYKRLTEGFESASKAETLTVKVDTSAVMPVIASAEARIAKAWESIRRAKCEIAHERMNLEALRAEKIDIRREGWNDCKAVMQRTLKQQIKHPDSDNFILRDYSSLADVRSFVASFHFDASKP